MRQPVGPLVAVSAAGVLAWLATVVAIRIARRPRTPRPGPETMELRPEPPAVAGMLAHDFEVTPDGVPATLIDLAARGALEIEQYGDDTFVVTRDRGLDFLPHEQRVLDHVHDLADGGRVPAAALTTGPQARAGRWWSGFRKEVVADARRRGLCRPVWDGRVVTGLWVALAGLGLLLWAGARFDFENVEITPVYVLAFFGTVLAAVVAVVVTASSRQRDTALGRTAAAHWLGFREHHEANEVVPTLPPAAVAVRGRYLAYCAALGLAAGTVRALPLGAEDDSRAWSNYGGGWRQVRVTYPRFRPGWGRRPWVALMAGAVGTFVSVNVLRAGAAVRSADAGGLADYRGLFERAGGAVIVVGALAVVWFGTEVLLALAELVSGDRRVTGEIVRRRDRSGFEMGARRNESARKRFVAVDSGAGDRITAWSVRRELYDSCAQGQRVQAVVTPVLHHVRSIESAR